MDEQTDNTITDTLEAPVVIPAVPEKKGNSFSINSYQVDLVHNSMSVMWKVTDDDGKVVKQGMTRIFDRTQPKKDKDGRFVMENGKVVNETIKEFSDFINDFIPQVKQQLLSDKVKETEGLK